MEMNEKITGFLSTLPKDSLLDNMTQIISKKTCISICQFCISEKIPFTFFFIDFDTFKKVNDTLGHPTGDKALIDSARMLKECIQDEGIVCRFGGDEFAILMPDMEKRNDVWQTARKYSEYFRHHPLSYLKNVFLDGRITLTSGIVRFPLDANDFPSLLSLADKALYRGKSKGKNCFIIYDKILHESIDKDLKKNKLNVAGLIHFIFETFDDGSKDLDESLLYTSELISNYYENAIVEFAQKDDVHILFSDLSQKDVRLSEIPFQAFHFEQGSWFIRFSLDNMLEGEGDTLLAKSLEKTGCRSLLAFKVVGKDKKPGVYIILARRDKIWDDDEFHMYEINAMLFSSLNKR